jgi:hypothetical protein
MGGIMGWMKFEVAPGDLGPVQEQFLKVFSLHELPRGAALFSDHQFSRPRTTVYISPKAAEIAQILVRAYRAVPCDAPEEGIFQLGHDEDRTMVPTPKDWSPT